VTLLFPKEGIGARIYPHDLSQFLNDFYRKKGVELLLVEQVSGISSHRHSHGLKTLSARELIAQPGPFRAEDLNAKKAPGWKIAY